jgi:hypothetical protein
VDGCKPLLTGPTADLLAHLRSKLPEENVSARPVHSFPRNFNFSSVDVSSGDNLIVSGTERLKLSWKGSGWRWPWVWEGNARLPAFMAAPPPAALAAATAARTAAEGGASRLDLRGAALDHIPADVWDLAAPGTACRILPAASSHAC